MPSKRCCALYGKGTLQAAMWCITSRVVLPIVYTTEIHTFCERRHGPSGLYHGNGCSSTKEGSENCRDTSGQFPWVVLLLTGCAETTRTDHAVQIFLTQVSTSLPLAQDGAAASCRCTNAAKTQVSGPWPTAMDACVQYPSCEALLKQWKMSVWMHTCVCGLHLASLR